MNKRLFKKVFIVFILLIFFIILNSKTSFAGTQNLNNLNFEINIENNGDMRIIETWDIRIEETNTLFKTFPLDSTYDGIKDVFVVEISDSNKRMEFEKRNNYQYHVDENCFQALLNEDGDFEIAWGVNVNGLETRTFEISYTVKNHVKLYNDCAEVYWKLIGDNFEIPVDKITGTIKVPNGIENIEDLRVWAHGPLNGTIEKVDTENIYFEVENLPSYDFLEIRISTPTNIFSISNNIINKDKISEILAEETSFAEEANLRREKKAKTEKVLKIVFSIVECVLIVFFSIKLLKNNKKVSEKPKLIPYQEIDYFRDIPDSEASAAEAGFIYFYKKHGMQPYIGNIMSATMLHIALKEWIKFKVVQNKKKEEIQVEVLKSGKQKLTEDEDLVYDFLVKVSETKIDGIFTMKEFEKYCIKNNTAFSKLLEKMVETTEVVVEKKEKYDKSKQKEKDAITISIVFYFILMFFMISLFFAFQPGIIITIILMLIIIANIISICRLDARVSGLTQKGIDEAENWEGLKKYMEEFSLIKDREIPELVLWEKYLVFATAFGVSDKVIKQLKVVYPELTDQDYMNGKYAYMHIACNSNSNFNFISSMSSSIGNVTNYSSGSGAGGGFSGGGGGGRRRRWRRRPLINKNILKTYLK